MDNEIKTIVFVEDSEVEFVVYRNALEKAGFCVQPAKDGLEAMRLLHNIAPDLVLLDLLLPRFDGVEVMKYIRSEPRLKNVPVIIFSTNSIIDSQDEPLLAAATKRLLKSQCTPALMVRAVRDVLAAAATKPANTEGASAAKPSPYDMDPEMNTSQRAEAALADS